MRKAEENKRAALQGWERVVGDTGQVEEVGTDCLGLNYCSVSIHSRSRVNHFDQSLPWEGKSFHRNFPPVGCRVRCCCTLS